MAFSGVSSSWLTVRMNADLASLAWRSRRAASAMREEVSSARSARVCSSEYFSRNTASTYSSVIRMTPLTSSRISPSLTTSPPMCSRPIR